MANDVQCSCCSRPIPQLPEGSEVPDPPETMTDLKYDDDSGVMVITASVTNVYCPSCSGSVGETLRRYLSKIAPKRQQTPPKKNRKSTADSGGTA